MGGTKDSVLMERTMALSWSNTLPAWWSFFWRAVLYGFLLGLVFGFFGGVLAAIMGTPNKAASFGAVAGFIAGIPASMLAFKQALVRHLSRLAALPNAGTE